MGPFRNILGLRWLRIDLNWFALYPCRRCKGSIFESAYVFFALCPIFIFCPHKFFPRNTKILTKTNLKRRYIVLYRATNFWRCHNVGTTLPQRCQNVILLTSVNLSFPTNLQRRYNQLSDAVYRVKYLRSTKEKAKQIVAENRASLAQKYLGISFC